MHELDDVRDLRQAERRDDLESLGPLVKKLCEEDELSDVWELVQRMGERLRQFREEGEIYTLHASHELAAGASWTEIAGDSL